MRLIPSIWIFQANPKRFKIKEALSNPEYTWDNWRVTRYKNDIKEGDLAIIWIAGKEAGIYAIANIMTNPRYTNEEFPLNRDEYFPKTTDGVDERKRDEDQGILKVRVSLTARFLNHPFYKSELIGISGLENLSIAIMPRATNFKVSESEWEIISRLIKNN